MSSLLGRAADTVVFADGFESGNLSAWTSTRLMSAQTQFSHSGTWAGRTTVVSDRGYASKSLATTSSDVTFTTRVNVLSHSGTAMLIRLRSATGAGIASLRINSTGRIQRRNEVVGSTLTSATVLSRSVWHELRLRAVVAQATPFLEVWLDGVRLVDVSGPTALGTAPVGQVQVGNSTKATMDVVFDDAQVLLGTAPATTPPLADAPPTAPSDLRATSVSSGRVELSWTASTDDRGVVAYGVYRDGVLIGTAPGTQTSFVDASVAPSRQYTYAVDAVDTASSRSASSAPLVVTTPTTDTAAPSIPADLTGQVTTNGAVLLTWGSSSDNVGVASYLVYRDGQQVAAVGGTMTSYTDATAAGGTAYAYAVSAVDAAGNESGRSAPTQVTPPEHDVVLTAAGDICFNRAPASCASSGNLTVGSDVVLALGDLQYPNGTLEEFIGAFDVSPWGGRGREGVLHAVPGNHEYNTPDAGGYRAYFGAGTGPLYETFVVGGIRFIGIDSNIDASVGSPQYQWLEGVLGANTQPCVVSYWHHSLFTSSAKHGPSPQMQPAWDLLASMGGDINLTGHNHHYERFGTFSSMVPIVAGTGATGSGYDFRTPAAAGSITRLKAQGVVRIVFDGTAWAGQFLRSDGVVADAFDGTC